MKTGTAPKATARLRLLKDGARWFPDAIVAVANFQEVVVSICRKLAEEYEEDLEGALGEKVRRVNECIEPAKGLFKWSQTRDAEAWVGVEILLSDKNWPIYLGVSWTREDEARWTSWAGIVFWTPGRFSEAAHAKLQLACRRKIELEKPTLLIGCKVTPSDMSKLEQLLKDDLRKWVKLWEKVGGIRGLGGSGQGGRRGTK